MVVFGDSIAIDHRGPPSPHPGPPRPYGAQARDERGFRPCPHIGLHARFALRASPQPGEVTAMRALFLRLAALGLVSAGLCQGAAAGEPQSLVIPKFVEETKSAGIDTVQGGATEANRTW